MNLTPQSTVNLLNEHTYFYSIKFPFAQRLVLIYNNKTGLRCPFAMNTTIRTATLNDAEYL